MKLNWKLCLSYNKQNRLLLKLVIAILLMGLAFRFFVVRSKEFSSSDLETPLVDETEIAEAEAKPPVVSTVDVSEYEDENQMMAARNNASSTLVAVDDVPEPEDQNQMMPNKNESAIIGVDVPEPEDQDQKPLNESAIVHFVFPQPEDRNEMPEKDFGPEKCDLFTGDWVPNPSEPVYNNVSCAFMDSHQNCMKNGRPDSDYLYWSWKPRNCEVPPFDPEKFLDMMRNKTMALIGHSISRNHVESLLCTLSTLLKFTMTRNRDEARFVFKWGLTLSKRWLFPSYNFSVSAIWSPFLVQAAIFEDFNGVASSEVELQLDKLDKKWTEQFMNLDYTIISTGKWFLKSSIYYENNTVLGCHYCPKRNLTELGFDFAYSKTLHHVLDFIATSKHKGLIFFRTSTPDHFENGEWHDGGTCKSQKPAKEGEIKLKDVHRILRDIELAEFEQAVGKAAKNGVNLKLLDLTNLLLMRPDGHPGPYREFQSFAKDKNATVQNDCLHWCLPGSIND